MNRTTHACGAGRRRQSGVGLIEVLVAVLVVSIGFLGVAALQATSLSTNNSAMARSMATVSAYSILDAMRLDRDNALAGSYNTTVTANACPAAGGTLASVQLNQWCGQLGQNLGAAATTTGSIACVSQPPSSSSVIGPGEGYCQVTITFDDSRSGAGGATNQTVTTKAAI